MIIDHRILHCEDAYLATCAECRLTLPGTPGLEWVPIWKVLSGRSSAIVRRPDLMEQYPPRQIVRPRVGYLFGFRTHIDAATFLHHCGDRKSARVVPAAAIIARRQPSVVPIAADDIRAFWHGLLRREACYPVPSGTVFCHALCCLE